MNYLFFHSILRFECELPSPLKKKEMLTNALRALVNNPFKESFYRKKKTINILTAFFISYKSGVKTFLK